MLGLLLGAALLGGLTSDPDYIDDFDNGNYPWEEDMYHNYTTCRELHDYNPATGCYSREEEEEQGYY